MHTNNYLGATLNNTRMIRCFKNFTLVIILAFGFTLPVFAQNAENLMAMNVESPEHVSSENSMNDKLNVFINPFENMVTINNLPLSSIRIQITDGNNNLYSENEMVNFRGTMRLHLPHLRKGTYFIKIFQEDKEIHKSVMKN